LYKVLVVAVVWAIANVSAHPTPTGKTNASPVPPVAARNLPAGPAPVGNFGDH